MSTKEIFIANLKKLRVEKGWSQYELASRSGLSSKQVSRLETGGSFPTSATLDILSSTFGVPVSSFFVDPGDPYAAIDFRVLYTIVNELSTFYTTSIKATTNALFSDMRELIKENRFDRFEFEKLIDPDTLTSYFEKSRKESVDIKEVMKGAISEMMKDSLLKNDKE